MEMHIEKVIIQICLWKELPLLKMWKKIFTPTKPHLFDDIPLTKLMLQEFSNTLSADYQTDT